MSKTVTVHCGHSSGMQLRNFKEVEREGVKQHLPVDTAPVELKAGENKGIDKDFMDAWMDNPGNNALKSLITVTPEDEPEQEPAPEEVSNDQRADGGQLDGGQPQGNELRSRPDQGSTEEAPAGHVNPTDGNGIGAGEPQDEDNKSSPFGKSRRK